MKYLILLTILSFKLNADTFLVVYPHIFEAADKIIVQSNRHEKDKVEIEARELQAFKAMMVKSYKSPVRAPLDTKLPFVAMPPFNIVIQKKIGLKYQTICSIGVFSDRLKNKKNYSEMLNFLINSENKKNRETEWLKKLLKLLNKSNIKE